MPCHRSRSTIDPLASRAVLQCQRLRCRAQAGRTPTQATSRATKDMRKSTPCSQNTRAHKLPAVLSYKAASPLYESVIINHILPSHQLCVGAPTAAPPACGVANSSLFTFKYKWYHVMVHGETKARTPPHTSAHSHDLDTVLLRTDDGQPSSEQCSRGMSSPALPGTPLKGRRW